MMDGKYSGNTNEILTGGKNFGSNAKKRMLVSTGGHRLYISNHLLMLVRKIFSNKKGGTTQIS